MDKLTILNRALVATGNSRLLVLNDGTDEWIAADTAFERAIDYLIGEHQWPFVTATLDLTRTGDAVRLPFTDAFQYPPNCWHLRTIFNTETGQPVDYAIIGNSIQAKTSENLRALFVTRPDSVDTTWHPAANEVLTLLVEAELWRGLNGDPDVGGMVWQRAEAMLVRAASRVDQQTGPKQSKMSRIGTARRTRRIS